MIKKSLAVAVILLFIGMCVVPSTAITDFKDVSTVCFDGNTLYVGGSGPNNYTSIQGAIENSSHGDTVFVYKGIYFENIFIYTDIKLIGENRENTIIDGNKSGSVVAFKTNGGEVRGFTIQNSGNKWYRDSGVQLSKWNSYSNDHIVKGNKIVGNHDGIFAIGSERNIISDNIFENNSHKSIFFQNSVHDIEIYNNTFDYTGIIFEGCRRNNIFNNQFTNYSSSGISILESNNNNIFLNYFNNLTTAVRIGPRSTYNTISNNNIANCEYGIKLYYNNNDIINNNILNNENGIFIETTFYGNHIIENNFIGNKKDARFIIYGGFGGSLYYIKNEANNWDRNYWGRSRLFAPKVILGLNIAEIEIMYQIWIYLFFPTFDLDKNPAQEPYDIGV